MIYMVSYKSVAMNLPKLLLDGLYIFMKNFSEPAKLQKKIYNQLENVKKYKINIYSVSCESWSVFWQLKYLSMEGI